MRNWFQPQRDLDIRLQTAARAFTLIELLVVVSIMTLLVALLLPALGKARFQAQKMYAMSQMRQQVTGWNIIALDYEGKLPKGSPRPQGVGPNTWRDLGYGFDLSKQMEEYGFIAASSHPVVGAPAYSDPAFIGVGLDQGPWAYFPGWQTKWMTPDQPQENIEPQPVLLDDAGPNNVMMHETLQYHRFSGLRNSVYYDRKVAPTTVSTNGAPRYIHTNGPNPLGTHIGRYDGSVNWQEFTFIFAGDHDHRQAHIGGNWITALYCNE